MGREKLSKFFCLLFVAFVLKKAEATENHISIKNILKENLQQNVGADFNDAKIATGCEDVNLMPNLDVKKLFKGNKIWYEMEKNENNQGELNECAKTVRMTLIFDTQAYFDFEYQNPKDGIDLWGHIDTSDQNNFHIRIDKPPHLNGSTFYILDTDYDNYILLYSCSSEGKENFWILIGQEEPSDNLRELINKAIKQQSQDFQDKLSSMDKCEEIHLLDTCRNKTNMEGLDLTKFAEESWFEQIRSSNDWEGNEICANLNYTYDGKTLTVLYENSGKPVKYLAFNVLKNDNDLLLDTSDDDFFYFITDTDYENYTIIYSCNQISKSEKKEKLWILGKYSKISEDVINAVGKEYEGISMNITCPLPPPTTTVEPATKTTQESETSTSTTFSTTQNDDNETTTFSEDITTSNPDDGEGSASGLIPCLLTSFISITAVVLLY